MMKYQKQPEKLDLLHTRKPSRETLDYSLETIQARREWNNFFKGLKKTGKGRKSFQPMIL